MIRKGSLNEKLERTAISPVLPSNVKNRDQNENKNRGPEDIKAKLLSVALRSVLKTEAMSNCNLSFSQAVRYFGILISKGLLSAEKNNGKQTFKTTEKGKRWLEQFRKLRDIENGTYYNDIRYIA
jgi:predicted transcriptional regulator